MMPVKVPNGNDLLAKLIELYADQMGVKVTYELEGLERLEGRRMKGGPEDPTCHAAEEQRKEGRRWRKTETF